MGKGPTGRPGLLQGNSPASKVSLTETLRPGHGGTALLVVAEIIQVVIKLVPGARNNVCLYGRGFLRLSVQVGQTVLERG